MVDTTGRIKKQDYNDADNPAESSDVIGTVTRDYDGNQRLTELRAPQEATTTFGYDPNGAQESYGQANGISSGFTYDDAGKLKSIDTTKTNGSSILNIDYDYLDEMNIGTETVSGSTQTYKYDDSKQLTEWKKAGVTTNYGYDAAGNITSAGNTTYGYDTSANEMTAANDGVTTTTFEYDASGNLTKALSGADTTNYSWDGNNRLSIIGSANTTLTFSYDSENKRLTKTKGTTTTGFVYDGINLIAEKDASGTITAKYYRNDSGQLVSMKKNNQNYYFHLNHRGDVIKITNASETVVAEYSYDPWGNILETSGTFANEQPFRYASYYWDSEIGMYYLINRYYDPALRRFISRDPASDTEGVGTASETNVYAYVGNNPVVAFDPDGLITIKPIWGGAWGSSHNRTVVVRLYTLDKVGIEIHGLQFTLRWKVYRSGTAWKIKNKGWHGVSRTLEDVGGWPWDIVQGESSPYDNKHTDLGHGGINSLTFFTESTFYVGDVKGQGSEKLGNWPDLSSEYRHQHRIEVTIAVNRDPVVKAYRSGNYKGKMPVVIDGAALWWKSYYFQKYSKAGVEQANFRKEETKWIYDV